MAPTVVRARARSAERGLGAGADAAETERLQALLLNTWRCMLHRKIRPLLARVTRA
jgi:hypothetical protein